VYCKNHTEYSTSVQLAHVKNRQYFYMFQLLSLAIFREYRY